MVVTAGLKNESLIIVEMTKQSFVIGGGTELKVYSEEWEKEVTEKMGKTLIL